MSSGTRLGIEELNFVALEQFIHSPVNHSMVSYLTKAASNVLQCDPNRMPPAPHYKTQYSTLLRTPLPTIILCDDGGLPSFDKFIKQSPAGGASWLVANVTWTLLYELVHSHRDTTEDTKAGVKNLVLLYANPDGSTPEERFDTTPLLRQLAATQVLLLTAGGMLGGFGFGYSAYQDQKEYRSGLLATTLYIRSDSAVTIIETTAVLATMLSRVCLEELESCAWWFKVGMPSTLEGRWWLG
ncbi:hypothetical protein HD806DRAFT_544968 [Xylariaceae sp. AK1471]|nr:hypothetical protein HD806DRAFT_544968 [Xylariaceae sp. AK1471]